MLFLSNANIDEYQVLWNDLKISLSLRNNKYSKIVAGVVETLARYGSINETTGLSRDNTGETVKI